MKFYPSDWRADPRLRICSMAARGLWLEMLAVMHEATPRGHLIVNGTAPSDPQLGVLTGCPGGDLAGLIGELEAAGVFSRTGKGVIYSRRMTRDEKRARAARRNGQRGGNPSLCNGEPIPPSDILPDIQSDDPPDNPEDNSAPNGTDNTQSPESRIQSESDPNGSGGAAAKARAPDLPLAKAFENFNQAAGILGLPRAQKLTADRSRKLAARLREHGLETWNRGLELLAESPFLLGDNKRGWRADFDFLLSPKSFNKLIEGAYAGGAAGESGGEAG